MIPRDSHTRATLPVRARRSDSVHNSSDRRNPDKRCGKDSPLAPEARNIVGDDFAHQPRLIFGRHDARPFHIFPFHVQAR